MHTVQSTTKRLAVSVPFFTAHDREKETGQIFINAIAMLYVYFNEWNN